MEGDGLGQVVVNVGVDARESKLDASEGGLVPPTKEGLPAAGCCCSGKRGFCGCEVEAGKADVKGCDPIWAGKAAWGRTRAWTAGVTWKKRPG